MRIHSDRFLKLLPCAVKIALCPESNRNIVTEPNRKRVQISCAREFLASFLEAPKVNKVFPETYACAHGIWIEPNGFFKFHLGFFEFPFVLKLRVGECGVGFSQLGIEFQCPLSRLLCFGNGISGGQVSPESSQIVGLRETCIGKSERGIQSNCLAKQLDTVGETFLGKLA